MEEAVPKLQNPPKAHPRCLFEGPSKLELALGGPVYYTYTEDPPKTALVIIEACILGFRVKGFKGLGMFTAKEKLNADLD